MQEIFHRVSIRKYEARAVEPEKIKQLLRAGMAAPSAMNQQPWEFYVVNDQDKLVALSRCSPYAKPLAQAPVGIVVCCRANCRVPMYAQIDCSAAVENILLEADALGLGAVWMGIAPLQDRMEAARAVLSMPEELYAFAFIACGYPAEARKQEDRFDESRIHYV